MGTDYINYDSTIAALKESPTELTRKKPKISPKIMEILKNRARRVNNAKKRGGKK